MTFEQLTTIFAGIVFASSLVTTLPVQANLDQGQMHVTNAKAGLNLRNQNCDVIETFGYGSVVVDFPSKSDINCNIKGKNYTLTSVETKYGSGYMATNYLTKVEHNGFRNGPSTYVNASIGLNIRDGACNKIGALPHKSPVTAYGSGVFDSQLCQVDGVVYLMTPIDLNGQIVYMADKYLA
jgi:hypothetical protein